MDSATESVHIGQLRSATLEQLKSWAQEGHVLVKTAKALGIADDKLAAFDGTFNGQPGAGTTIRSRPGATRTRTRARTRSTGATAGKQTPQQALTWLKEHPGVSARDLSKALRVSSDTAQKWMRELEASGQVRREGERNQTQWFAREMVGAGA